MDCLHHNSLKTKEDIARLAESMWQPLDPYYDKSHSRIQVGQTAAAYPEHVAGLECFSRVLWGAAPLLMVKGEAALWPRHLDGIINGTDPESDGYWGEIADYDQRIVEMAAFGYALCLAPEYVWEPLSSSQQENLVQWLSQVNKHKAHDCNWLFFAVIVNIGLKKVGAYYSQETIDQHLDRIDDFYIGDGWYQDGEVAHVDYYTPFAIHYYGLFYAKIMEKDDPARARIYKQRAERFAEDFIHWFSDDGRALPYGRSLSYRFAQASFWSAYVFAGLSNIPLGVVKGIIFNHLRHWSKQDIFLPNGTLSIGYQYPNLHMAENYNAPGSPYWGFKIFLILALADDHPFWKSDEKRLPLSEEKVMQSNPRMMLVRDADADHVAAFTTGYQHTNAHTHASAKYEKFVYSNYFGFSVPRANFGLDQGAFDSMLAVSEQDNHYRVKQQIIEKRIEQDHIYIKWKPWQNVTIKTWLIPGLPWHVRIHQIDTARPLDIADGGFSLGLSDQDADNKCEHGNAETANGRVSALSLDKQGEAKCIFPNANTNIMEKRTVLPTVEASIEAGKHLLVHAFYGSPVSHDQSTSPSLENNILYTDQKTIALADLVGK
ncbi:DUF2264 domain-containing protein [Gracilibacillus caseinilyticus]|uniref:DUF2264 domain-containing protein n=1 Tax=Gracilibacillus caseinilyticus TaxID=2932256 RepID=A0ABY4EX40_9BACI|nr:DUF2264 domain-containing protein [Gracilibacillus caseinilyticus]UOQ48422.1 DUF2264 domain-containing protein [Gracilibacillus caseinilyticus]